MNNGFINPKLSFGERLEYLMKEAGINIAKKGADRELSIRMYNEGVFQYNSEDYDTKNKNIDTARRRIEEHRKVASASEISGRWLKAYCDYFHCSADYLFGYIELSTHEKTNINKATGLSDKPIQVLQEMKESPFGRRLLASLEILVLDVKKYNGDKYYKRFLELFSDFLHFSGDDNKIYSFNKNGEIKEEKPTYDEYGNKKFNKDRVTITSDRLKYMFIMEITDTLEHIKEEYDKNPKF